MPFQPKKKQPQFADLIVSLANSRQQTKDNALFQTVYLLLQRLTTARDLLVKDIEAVEDEIAKLLNQTFITLDDETIALPNSRRLLAGTGILFDDTVHGERTISSSSVINYYWSPLTDGSETAAELIYAAGEAIAVQCPNAAPFRP